MGTGAVLTVLTAVGTAAPDTNLLLVEAAKARDLPKIRTLLKEHADVNARAGDGATALLWAVHWDDLQTADLLIRAGADVNAANEYRITPLSVACANGNSALAEKLLEAGAHPNITNAAGETPVMTCARTGSAEAIKALLARGADVNAVEPNLNQSALMWATAEREGLQKFRSQSIRLGRGESELVRRTGLYLTNRMQHVQVP